MIDPTQVTWRMSEPDPDGVVPPNVPMPSVLGRYQIGPLLGAGGMAEVYRAYDATLNRYVALKFLREADREHLARFFREARAQAQVGHDNICDVYEAGIIDGRPFIAMRWIDGMTLADAAPRMSLDEKVAVVAEVAEAVHAAHRTGLIHRDLKPGNIMVEARPEGGWHSWVLDFGLARDASMDTMTTIGTVVGTPPYMAPEQARGDRSNIDRRTDVYSLGATLFDVIAGRPPFLADSMVDVIVKVVSEDAPSLRSLVPSAPADLETIVAKCLEKDPRQRYDSARAFGDDLRRYLDGEPIEARRTSLVDRWMRRIRKHPTIAALLGMAFIAVLASIGWAAATSVQSAERQQAAQRFGQEVERIEAVARYASMLPPHDVRSQRERIRAQIARIEDDLPSGRASARGPARYAAGRGYLALREWDASRRHLEAAWNDDYRTPEVAYALGRVFGAQYQEALEDAERLPGADARAARRRQVEKEYRDRALEWLRRSGGTSSESPAYAEGLIAFYEKRYDVALERARKAFADVPWLHEARKLEGDIWIARAIEQFSTGDYDGAVMSGDRAGEAYAVAESIGSSDETVPNADAERWFRRVVIALARGEDPEPYVREGVAAAERALAIRPDFEPALRTQAVMLQRFGEWQLSQGQPALETIERSIVLARAAVKANPASAAAHRTLGVTLFGRARFAAGRGEDPIPFYDASIASFGIALERDPNGVHVLVGLANSIRRKAEETGARGGDPLPLLDQSIAHYDRAVALDVAWANIFNDRGLAFMTRGEWEMENGKDPTASFAESARSLERAIAINPKMSTAILNLGSVHLDRADYHVRRGGDPRAAVDEAVRAYDAALAINPKLAIAHANSGLAHVVVAQWALAVRADPRPAIERGRAAYARALEINPEHASSWAHAGMLGLLEARHVARAGGDPTPMLQDGRTRLRKALAINPEAGGFLEFAAAIEADAARHALARGRSAGAALAAGDAFVARGLTMNPNAPDLLYVAADLQRLRRDHARALALVERALAIDGEDADAHALRGELLLELGRNGDAVTAFDRAIALNPAARWQWDELRGRASGT